MIRALVRLGAWLDKRFPEKVVMKQAELLTLKAQINTARITLIDDDSRIERLVVRLATLEAQIAAIRDTIIKSGLREPTETERRRAAFVESGRMQE